MVCASSVSIEKILEMGRGENHHHCHHHGLAQDVQAIEFAAENVHRDAPFATVEGQLVKVFSKANPDYNLGVRHDGVVLLPANPDDKSQQWVQDMSWSTRVKDEKGFPAFVLINRATNKALKHATDELQQVLLVDYRPGFLDETTLWTESEDMGGGFKTIRMASNIRMNLDAYRGDKKSGGIKEGTPAVLFKWKKQDNQLWKLHPLY